MKNCTVCTSDRLEEIDQDLVTGIPVRSMETEYGLSKSALDRHRAHLSETLLVASDAREEVRGIALLDQVQDLVAKSLASHDRAVIQGDERLVQGGIREARHSLELTGRITGELHEKRDDAPDSAVAAIIQLAHALSEVELRGMAKGEIIEVAGHVV